MEKMNKPIKEYEGEKLETIVTKYSKEEQEEVEKTYALKT